MLQDIKHAASSLRSPPKAQFRGRPSGDHGPAAAMTDSKTIQAMLAREASMRASSRDLSGTYGEGFLPKANRVNSPTPSWAKDQNGMLRSDPERVGPDDLIRRCGREGNMGLCMCCAMVREREYSNIALYS